MVKMEDSLVNLIIIIAKVGGGTIPGSRLKPSRPVASAL